jgi:hypothetical protein
VQQLTTEFELLEKNKVKPCIMKREISFSLMKNDEETAIKNLPKEVNINTTKNQL